MFLIKQTTRPLFIVLFVVLSFKISVAQKVGVVLSGGGASGIAHVGVLKALEDNGIPVDYIAGSSEGALIGALYASGYSPAEIERLINNATFKDISQGVIDHKYQYYFKRNDNSASWISFKLSLDSVITAQLPTNLISPIALDFGLLEFFSAPGAAAGYNFDSLYIPFRCIAAEIEQKESVIFRKGNLAEAVRASITYPFYISPIAIDGKLLFDGGLYNNFPANVMYNDFFPDFIIGSNVGSNTSPGEDDLFSQIKCMLQSKSNYNIQCENGVIIQPKTNVGTFNFKNPQPVIDSGYAATMREMEAIKKNVSRRTTAEELTAKRKAFKTKEPVMVFDSIKIEGLTKTQSEYAIKILHHHKEKQISLEEIKQGYFRLAGDSKIKSIYPKAILNPKTGFYDLHLKIKKERHLTAYFGGNFSNRPISEGFVGLQYDYLSTFATSLMANTYFGKLYSSVQLKTRLDFPLKTPLYIEPCFTWNSWDYYKSSNAFLEDIKPAYLKQGEKFGNLNVGFPTGKKGRIVVGGGVTDITSYYYQSSNFTQQDTADHTDFNAFTSQLYYEVNSLNRKQYASQGEHIMARVKYINGSEATVPGTTSTDTVKRFMKFHEWIQLKLTAERYFNRRGTFKIGIFGEGSFSTQTSFHNYTASILSAPAFQPTPDSKTIFLQEYRAYKYIAGGLKFILNIRKNIELRMEGYVFQPYETLIKNPDFSTSFSKPFEFRNVIGMGAIIWHTPVGPMSLSANYYNAEKNPLSILFHFGYVIFNNSSLE
jgi:NTE family protein